MKFRLNSGAGGSGGGLTRVADQAARLAITPATDGFTVLQLDTDEIYDWDLPTSSWRRIAGPQLAFSFTDTSSIDVTYNPTSQDLQAALRLSAALASVGSLKVNHVINSDGLFAQIPYATALVRGVLTNTDWARFDQAVQNIANHLDTLVNSQHDADQIDFAPVGNISSTDVQAAIAELDSETDARLDALELVSHVAATIGAFANTPNANGLSIVGQAISLAAADGTNPGGLTAGTQSIGGFKTFLGEIQADIDVRLADRTAANPALVFSSDLATGFYRIGTGQVGLSILTNGRFAFRDAGLTIGSVAALADSEALAINRAGAVKLGSATSAEVSAWTTINQGAMVYNSTELQANVYVNSGWQHLGGKLRLVASDPLLLSPAGSFNGNPFFRCMRRVAGNGAAVTATVSRTLCVDGMELYIVGTSDTNTVTLEPDANLAINGSITLGNGDTLQLVFDGAANIWREFGRSD